MNLAWISIGALVLAVGLSCTNAVNVGVLSLALAWIVGVYLGGMPADTVLDGFPAPLLVTLLGVTLLFSIADCNGTLPRLTERPCGSAAAAPFCFQSSSSFLDWLCRRSAPARRPPRRFSRRPRWR